MKRSNLWILAGLFCIALAAWAHPGKTDSQGGHYERKTGKYHFHNSGDGSGRKPYTPPKRYDPRPPASENPSYRPPQPTATYAPRTTTTLSTDGATTASLYFSSEFPGQYHAWGCEKVKQTAFPVTLEQIDRGALAPCIFCKPIRNDMKMD